MEDVMNEKWSFSRCVAVLTGEIVLLKKISAAQNIVRQAVMDREWTDFDEKTAEVNRLGAEFALLEDERIRLLSALNRVSDRGEESSSDPNNGEGRPLYALIMNLPNEESLELSRLYRELRMETLKMRAMNETLLVYTNEAKTMAAAYLEAVCPARGGKLYTRRGRKVSQDLKSMVFNNQF